MLVHESISEDYVTYFQVQLTIKGDINFLTPFHVAYNELNTLRFQFIIHAHIIEMSFLEINQYGFFGADTNISAIHGPIADTNNQGCQVVGSWRFLGGVGVGFLTILGVRYFTSDLATLPITDISQNFKVYFLFHYQKYYASFALPFLKNLSNQDLWPKFFKLQQF